MLHIVRVFLDSGFSVLRQVLVHVCFQSIYWFVCGRQRIPPTDAFQGHCRKSDMDITALKKDK